MVVSYSSTVIEEALQVGIPVMQFDPQGKYCHIAGQQLDPASAPQVDACYFVSSRDHLPWALRWLQLHHFSQPPAATRWDVHRFAAPRGLMPLLEAIGLTSQVAHTPEDGPTPRVEQAG